jgi:putative endonuclease
VPSSPRFRFARPAPAPINRSALGAAAEDRAAAALISAGYRIVERNVRLRRGELDAVAWDGDVFVFIEVRSRGSARFGGAPLAISHGKRRQVARMAQLYLATRPPSPPPRRFRFDVVAITGDELVILRDAFRL